MYVVTGATGQTGSVVARTLLSQGKPVRVVVRDEKKGAEWKQKGAEVVVASLQDGRAVAEALRGAEGAYLMVPPIYHQTQTLEKQKQIIDHYAAAPRPGHVVLLSSIGGERPSGTGPIVGLHYAEEKLKPEATLRAGYFLENWGGLLPVAREQSILPTPLRLDHKISMVDVEDIGRTAARLLVERHKGLVQLAGAEDASPNDVARVVSKLLGKEVRAVPIPEAGIVEAFQGFFGAELAELFREMDVALNRDEIAWQGTPLRGKVTLEEALRKLLQ